MNGVLLTRRYDILDTNNILYHYITGIEGFGERVGKLECHASIISFTGKHQGSLDRYDCGLEFI